MILALDPGNTHTAGVVLDPSSVVPRLVDHWYLPNEEAIMKLEGYPLVDHLAIEMIACYGMAVGAEVFDTCVWIGRYIERWNKPYKKVFRRDVKLYLCNSVKAKDGNVRQALVDMYGGTPSIKKGGQLYKVAGDEWAAIGVGVTYIAMNALSEKES